ncbi:hypothetical protein SISSUDRAFT_1039841 [Sistotremastrum suecicum HHB10207 ss-3]|uniref:SAGA-associated factor 11 n=1 Tax=Sistotremastrum suecicum HHB10207 ss-3 TaxID=1314776 RepID=A0A166INK9_9AGAM|nr:hypothetical protein SISSUDRAFT_1039841 [Sistotremastrum suecicum HHB10207 ss-3]
MSDPSTDEILDSYANALFDKMIGDIVLDIALQSHKQISRSKAVCNICHTRCGQIHLPLPASVAASSRSQGSRTASPSPSAKQDSNGTSTPTQKGDGNIYFDCLNCKRPIASNRYVPHMSSCMGIGTVRRGTTRNINGKPKSGSDAGRSSPFPDSASQGEPSASQSKPKPKKSKPGSQASEDGVSPKKRRPSEDTAALSSSKKHKPSLERSPSASESITIQSLSQSSQVKIPSKLRESSATTLRENSASPANSPKSDSGTSTASSGSSATSPIRGNERIPNGKTTLAKNTSTSSDISMLKSHPLSAAALRQRAQTSSVDYIVDVDDDVDDSSSSDDD